MKVDGDEPETDPEISNRQIYRSLAKRVMENADAEEEVYTVSIRRLRSIRSNALGKVGRYISHRLATEK